MKLINKLQPQLTSQACAALYQSMVIPTLTYCGIANLNKTNTQVDRSNALHWRGCRLIGNQRYSQIKSPESIIRYKVLEIVWKSLNGEICSNFKNYFELTNHNKSTRNNSISIKLPKLKLEFARGSLWYYGAKLFNDLPLETRKMYKLSTFLDII